MKQPQRYILGCAAAAGLFLGGSLLHSRGSVAKGAYSTPVTIMNTTANSVPSSPAVPGAPFLQELSNNSGAPQLQAFGPGTGAAFAVSALTFTNFGTGSQTVRVFQPILNGGSSCFSASVIGGGQGVRVNLQPGQSYELTFPTPLVFAPNNGLLCGAMSFQNSDGTISVSAVGYSN